MVSAETADALEALLVDIERGGARHPAGELIPDVDRQAALTGDHLVEGGRRLVPHPGGRFIHVLRELPHDSRKASGLADLLGHETRDLVAMAGMGALLSLESKQALPRDEGPDTVIPGGEPARPLEPRLEVAQQSGRANHYARALRVAAQDPALSPGARAARVGESEDVHDRRAPHPLAHGWQPCDADRCDERIAVEPGESGCEVRRAGVDGLVALGGAVQPLLDPRALDGRFGKDEIDAVHAIRLSVAAFDPPCKLRLRPSAEHWASQSFVQRLRRRLSSTRRGCARRTASRMPERCRTPRANRCRS